MARLEALHPDGSDLDGFLYACVGEDKNGASVTVVSALARLGLDPWREAAELAVIGRNAACRRLGGLLSAFEDVPALRLDHGAVAAELAALLPDRLSQRVSQMAGPAARFDGRSIPIGRIVSSIVVILMLLWIYFLAHAG